MQYVEECFVVCCKCYHPNVSPWLETSLRFAYVFQEAIKRQPHYNNINNNNDNNNNNYYYFYTQQYNHTEKQENESVLTTEYCKSFISVSNLSSGYIRNDV
jgi:hypothetical protein